MKIRDRFLATSLAITLVVLTCATLALDLRLKSQELSRLRERIHLNNDLLQEVLASPVHETDEEQVRKICTAFFSDPELISLGLAGVPEPMRVSLAKDDLPGHAGERLEFTVPLAWEGRPVGELRLVYSTSLIEEKLANLRRAMILVAILISLFLILIFARLSEIITAPIATLGYALRRVNHGDFTQPLQLKGHGEFQELESHFNHMVASLRENEVRQKAHTAEMEAKNHDLEEEMRYRKQAEEALRQAQKLEAVGRLAGGVAHDFNNLLTAILGYAEISLDDLPENHPVRDNLGEIRNAGERARDLTEQLLAVGRKRAIHIESLSVESVLRGAERLLAKTMGPHIDFEVTVSDGTGQILADSGALGQILLNLSVNARDAMPEGGRLSLRAGRESTVQPPGLPGAGAFVRIEVEDQGHGIDPEHMDHIFEPFFTTKGEKGNGLGLAMVYSLVQQLHGGIQVRSAPGQGTCFTLFFPAASQADGQRPSSALPLPLRPGKGKILLVEDDAQVRLVSERTLQSLSYEVLIARHGEEGLAILREEGASILAIVSDILMPHLDGPNMIRKARSEGLHHPVLFITGYGHQSLEELLDEPDVFLLYKPYSRDDIGRVLAEILPHPADSDAIKPA